MAAGAAEPPRILELPSCRRAVAVRPRTARTVFPMRVWWKITGAGAGWLVYLVSLYCIPFDRPRDYDYYDLAEEEGIGIEVWINYSMGHSSLFWFE